MTPAFTGMQQFIKLDGYTENGIPPTGVDWVVARSWADLGITPGPQVILDDDIGDVPVLLYQLGIGETPATAPLIREAYANSTPVVGRFTNTGYNPDLGVVTFLFDPTAPEIQLVLANVAITRKFPMYVDCAGVGGYMEDGLTTPSDVWCFGGVNHVADGVNLFKRMSPNQYHLDYQAVQRVSDGTPFAYFPVGEALASGNFIPSTATLYTNNPAVGTVAGLGDTACP